MKTIVIIQARMGSSRLPGKVLKPFGNEDVLTYVVERCKKITDAAEVIVATSILDQDDLIENWCRNNQVICFRGSETDVLDRYIQSAKQYEPDYIMRVTADCPFVDFEMANEMIQLIKENPVDVVDVGGELPRGISVELVSYPALLYIDRHGVEARHREHVTYYAYEYKEEFTRIKYSPKNDLQYPKLRITLDTEEDYQLCENIANHFKEIGVSSSDVIEYLLKHPEIAKINQHIEQKPVI